MSIRNTPDDGLDTTVPESPERAELRELATTIVSDPTFAEGLKRFRNLAVETDSTLALIGKDNDRGNPFVALMDPAPLFFAHAQAGLALPSLLLRIETLKVALKPFADDNFVSGSQMVDAIKAARKALTTGGKQ